MGLVLGSLAERGYGFAYRVLDAQFFGVPQRRRRVFVAGHLGDGAAPVEVLLEPEGRERDPAPRAAARARVAGTLGSRAGGSRTTDLDGHGAYVVNALTAGSGGGCGPDDNDAQAGHLVVGAVTSRQGKGADSEATQTLVSYALRSNPGGVGNGHNVNYITHALTAEGYDAGEDGTGRGTPLVPMAFDWQTDGSDRARPNISTAHTSALATTKRDAVAAMSAVRRLTPTECERLQGYPDGWTEGQSDAARYRQLGNTVAVPVVEWITRRLVAVNARRPA